MAKAKSKKTSKKTSKAKGKSASSASPLAQARAYLSKTFAKKDDDPLVLLDPSQFKESQPVINTGCFALDTFLGGSPNKHGVVPYPGIARGKILQLYGQPSSGKTTLALMTAAQVIKNGGTVCYIDFENEIDPIYTERLGVPIGDKNRFLLYQPVTLEDGFAIAYTMVTAGVDLVVIDSVGAAISQKQMDKSLTDMSGEAQIGFLARFWSQKLPPIKGKMNRSGTTMIAISQLRTNISSMSYGDSKSVQGGKGWQFYSAYRLYLQRIRSEKGKIYSSLTNKTEEAVVGGLIRVRAEKCKMSDIQQQEVLFYVRHGEGIDNLRTNIEIASNYGIIDKAGAWYTWIMPDGETHRTQGVDNLRSFFQQNESLQQVLEEQIREKIYRSRKHREQEIIQTNIEEDLLGDLSSVGDELTTLLKD